MISSLKMQQQNNTEVDVLASIGSTKANYEKVIQEIAELTQTKEDHEEIIQKFKERSLKLAKTVEENKQSYNKHLDNEMLKLDLLKQKESELMEEIRNAEKALQEEEKTNDHLSQEEALAFTSLPEKRVVFTGRKRIEVTDEVPNFEVKSHIVYPMEEGTALITFEKEVVAGNILRLKQHQVQLANGCFITLEAHAVHLLLPSLVEMDTAICPRRILISNLPQMNNETLLDKLNIHFHSRKHGGGEVESCEFLPDSGTVVLTFVNPDVAGGLTGFHNVKLQNNREHRIKVTPFINGQPSNFQTKMVQCPRTVLLTGIPPIMDQETLQDMLEIHFQRNSSGGGEIEALLYNPVAHKTSAVFESSDPN